MSRNDINTSIFYTKDLPPIRWWTTDYLVPYEESLRIMEYEAQRIALDDADELVWVLEHPPIYTAGTSAKADDLIIPQRFPIYHTGRGGSYTYHGPGQLIVYIMLDLKKRCKDVRCFIAAIEEIIIRTLKILGISGERREDRIGIWVARTDKTILKNEPLIEEKIAAIGIRIRKWTSFHGFSLNISPDLNHYNGIIPCGIQQYGVTSLKELGCSCSKQHINNLIRESFESIFGHTILYEYTKK